MFFALYILVFSLTTIRQLYYITKMPKFGLYEYKVEGSGCGFNQKRDHHNLQLGAFPCGRSRSGSPVPTPLDPRMNKRPKTMNILPHASNTPDCTPSIFLDFKSF